MHPKITIDTPSSKTIQVTLRRYDFYAKKYKKLIYILYRNLMTYNGSLRILLPKTI